MAGNLDKLYEKYNALSEAKDKVSEHSDEYLESMEGVKGTESEKMLSAQILSKFFKHFPALQKKALNALLDLCEDEESQIRACAMRYLVSICKDVKENVAKVTDILAQMMQLDDMKDFNTATWCLSQLFKDDPVIVLTTFFNHINILDEVTSREKCIEFLYSKLLRPIQNQPIEVEKIVVEGSKKILQDEVGAQEMLRIIGCLTHTRHCKTLAGQQEIVELMSDLTELDHDFEPLEEGNVERLILCGSKIIPFFSSKNESTKFVAYFCDQVLPRLDKVNSLAQGPLLQLQLLRLLADLSVTCGKFENPSLHVVQVFDKLKQYMPLPPEDFATATAPADAGATATAETTERPMPNFEFSYVECLLFTFHRLARQCPDLLTHDPLVLQDLRTRMAYFSRGVQGCLKVIAGGDRLTKAKSGNDDAKLAVAPSMLTNINTLIKDLFYKPPVYRCEVTLSYKVAAKKANAGGVRIAPHKATSGGSGDKSIGASSKRHAPITFEGSPTKQSRGGGGRSGTDGGNVKLYAPPSGKFSNNFQSYDRNHRPRGRGGARGGRGGGRNWRNF